MGRLNGPSAALDSSLLAEKQVCCPYHSLLHSNVCVKAINRTLRKDFALMYGCNKVHGHAVWEAVPSCSTQGMSYDAEKTQWLESVRRKYCYLTVDLMVSVH